MIAITNITPSPWSETGFLREYSPHIVETAKNPVSLLLAGPETCFFENYSLRLVEVAKNPVSLRLPICLFIGWPETGFFREYFATHRRNCEKPGFFASRGARNRVFRELFAAPRRSGQKPGFFKTQNELF
jgi:hypothetical protein